VILHGLGMVFDPSAGILGIPGYLNGYVVDYWLYHLKPGKMGWFKTKDRTVYL